MRHQSWMSCEKHLAQIKKKEELSSFLIVSADVFDRGFLREAILERIKTLCGPLEVIKFDCEGLSFDQFYQECETKDLFAVFKIFYLSQFEKAGKQLVEQLSSYLSHNSQLIVIIEGEQNKLEAKLYDKLKKEMVAFDLIKEKSWEKKARVVHLAQKKCAYEKKKIAKDALEAMYEGCGRSTAIFMQELEKLLCYVGARHEMTASDIHSIGVLVQESNQWNICESFVWDPCESTYKDILQLEVKEQEFFSLLGQLRYQCQLGCRVHELLTSCGSDQACIEQLPPTQQKHFQKYKHVLSSLDPNFFPSALGLLYDYEIKAKSFYCDVQLLWISLVTHLKQRQTIGV